MSKLFLCFFVGISLISAAPLTAVAQVHVADAAAGGPLIDGPPAPTPPDTVSRDENGKITMRAVRIDQPLALDGALEEPAYRTVPSASHFIQQFPTSGNPATDDTEVWVFFDDRNVYVSVRCWDGRPEQMVANEMRRDNQNIWLNDNVIVVLDTFYDRKSAFFFQTNPVGGVRDALILDEASVNYDWNTVWDVRTRRFDQGWTAEMAIPFKSLRYRPAAAQVWGINVMRVVRGTNEQTLLSPPPRTYGGSGHQRLASAATLVGLVAPGGAANIELKPYAISSVTTNRPAGISNDGDAAIGIDAKYGVTSSLTFDFTYNTDFAQVEIDEQQVNLTRFSLFFPEKRDFFLEGQGIFDIAGSGGRRAGTADDTPILFFTRRIGLNAGQPVPIRVGARLMGRAGRTSIGILDIQSDEALAAGVEATNFTVVRARRDVLRRSSVGVMFTRRGVSVAGPGSNEVYAADGSFAFFENVRVNSYYARSATTSLRGDDESYRGQFQYLSDRYGIEAERLKVGRAFNPEVGFLRRQDFRRSFVLGRFSPRPKRLPGVRKLTWEASLARYVNQADVLETRQGKGSFRVELHSGDTFAVDYLNNYEFAAVPFPVAGGILTVPVGRHQFQEVAANYVLGSQRPLSGTLNVSRGGFYGGTRTQVGYTGRVIFNIHLALEPRASIDWVSLPQGRARISLLGARPILTIGPRMYVSALVQFNSSTHSLETNGRWRWEFSPGSDIYVVYTDGRDTARPGFPSLLNRGLAVKATRFLRF